MPEFFECVVYEPRCWPETHLARRGKGQCSGAAAQELNRASSEGEKDGGCKKKGENWPESHTKKGDGK